VNSRPNIIIIIIIVVVVVIACTSDDQLVCMIALMSGSGEHATGVLPGILVDVHLDDGQPEVPVDDVVLGVLVRRLDVEARVAFAAEDEQRTGGVGPGVRQPLDALRSVAGCPGRVETVDGDALRRYSRHFRHVAGDRRRRQNHCKKQKQANIYVYITTCECRTFYDMIFPVFLSCEEAAVVLQYDF